jgi:hypothetical protein
MVFEQNYPHLTPNKRYIRVQQENWVDQCILQTVSTTVLFDQFQTEHPLDFIGSARIFFLMELNCGHSNWYVCSITMCQSTNDKVLVLRILRESSIEIGAIRMGS